MNESYQDAALLLVAHGSRQNANSCAPALRIAAALRQRALFGQVAVAFCKQPPLIPQVLPALSACRIFVVPFFIGEGYFTQDFIPGELGLTESSVAGVPCSQRRGAQTLHYCGPVGTHASMTEVLLARAADALKLNPPHELPLSPSLSPPDGERVAKPGEGNLSGFRVPMGALERMEACQETISAAEVTLVLAGHGTGRNENSRKTLERHVERIRERRLYAAVHAVFLEEAPRISECYQLAATRHLVVVPCFISDGLHTTEDIPALLGEAPEVLQARRDRKEWPWRNPTLREGKWVWYTSGIGSEPHLPEVILERVREAASAALPCSA